MKKRATSPIKNCFVPNRKDFMEKVIEFKKPKKRKVIKEDSFVARLPYPITIHTLVDLAERMGIEYEHIVMPALKFIERTVVKEEKEK